MGSLKINKIKKIKKLYIQCVGTQNFQHTNIWVYMNKLVFFNISIYSGSAHYKFRRHISVHYKCPSVDFVSVVGRFSNKTNLFKFIYGFMKNKIK